MPFIIVAAAVAVQAHASRALLDATQAQKCPAKHLVLTGAACHYGPAGSVEVCDEGYPCGVGALKCTSAYELYRVAKDNNICKRESLPSLPLRMAYPSPYG